MSPLGFLQQRGAVVPRPHLHLIRFGERVTSLREHGALAPNTTLRTLVGPQEPEPPAPPAGCEPSCSHHRVVRLSRATLLERVCETDMEHGANGGGEPKHIAAILERPVIERILTHLGQRAGVRRARQPVGRSGKQPDRFDAGRLKNPFSRAGSLQV